ncbi:hypothetical protein B0H19DRAFT_1075590 [Mycena capillaripes]|nr:hypothetical protein B0H19DRAFT_1075590 [Mycena capillaripes]
MTARHIVAMLPPAWGHTITYIHAITQMINKDPAVAITIMQHNLVDGGGAFGVLLRKAPTSNYRSRQKKASAVLSVLIAEFNRVSVCSVEFGPTMLKEAFEQLIGGWMENIPQLAQGSEAWPKPQAIHLDFACGGFVVEPTKKIFGPGCKILMWWSSAVVSMPAHFNDYDFTAIANKIYADEARRDGRSLEDILQDVVVASNGTDKLSGHVNKYPGAPDMYDYERFPYAAGPPLDMGVMLATAQKLAKAVDGYIAVASSCVEPVGVPYCREFHKKRGQELKFYFRATSLYRTLSLRQWRHHVPVSPPLTAETGREIVTGASD